MTTISIPDYNKMKAGLYISIVVIAFLTGYSLYLGSTLSEAIQDIEMQNNNIEMLSEEHLKLIGLKWNRNYSSDNPSNAVSGYVFNECFRTALGVEIEIVFYDQNDNVIGSSVIEIGNILMRSDQGFDVELSCPEYPEVIRAFATLIQIYLGR